jgi:hypothetical protein
MLQVFLQINRNMWWISCVYISELPKIGIDWWSNRAISAKTTSRRGK